MRIRVMVEVEQDGERTRFEKDLEPHDGDCPSWLLGVGIAEAVRAVASREYNTLACAVHYMADTDSGEERCCDELDSNLIHAARELTRFWKEHDRALEKKISGKQEGKPCPTT